MKNAHHASLGQAVSESSICAIYLLSCSGHVLSWNIGAMRMKGSQERKVTGQHFSVFYRQAERDAGIPEANLDTARRHGMYKCEGWRVRGDDGNRFRASVEIEYLNPENEEQPAFIKIVRDVSVSYEERIAFLKAQELIRKHEAELTEASQLLDEVFTYTPCALILCDAENGKVIRANPTAMRSELLGSLVQSGNVTDITMDFIPANLGSVFSRGLQLEPGEGFKELLTSGEDVPTFALRISVERLVAGSMGTVLYTIEDITAEYQATAHASLQALHDPLTGLLNRRGLMVALERCLTDKTEFVVLILDVDRFKNINDVMGHHAGDLLLTEVAMRLRMNLRRDDIIARVGGDEFVILMYGIHNQEGPEEIASRLTSLLHEPYLIRGRKVISGCSIGVSQFPRDASDADEILSAAELALYEAKSAGRKCHVVYSEKLASGVAERSSLEDDLRSALDNDELFLFYQPVVNSKTENVEYYEALLRWNHPVRGNVPPEIFIPLAEETDLIHDIGAFVITRACNQVSAWPCNQRVAVNISPKQFRDPQLTGRVKQALKTSGITPERLELEITETALFDNAIDSHGVIREFREMGVNIALDDFGTGFSSLSYLRTNLFDQIKIDRSFINDLLTDSDAAAIVAAILTLCQQMGLEVTAEGVEKPEQAEWLKQYGCTRLQGYLFGVPGLYGDMKGNKNEVVA